MRHTHTHARVIRWRERKPRPKKAAGSEEDRAADVGASAALFSAPQSGAARVHVHVRARFHVRRRTARFSATWASRLLPYQSFTAARSSRDHRQY